MSGHQAGLMIFELDKEGPNSIVIPCLMLHCHTHVVLDVWLAAGPEEHPAALVVAVLAAEVERGEAAAVPQVVVALAHLAQELTGAAEPPPGGLVQRRVPVLKRKDRGEISYILKQGRHH